MTLVERLRQDRLLNPDYATRLEAAGRIEALEAALRNARTAIASLDEFELGGVDIADTHTGDCVGQYGVRDELLAEIDAALSSEPNQGWALHRDYAGEPMEPGEFRDPPKQEQGE